MRLPKTIRLLIVVNTGDDENRIRTALKNVEGTRYDIVSASSALAAIALVATTPFDIIFADSKLGVQTGTGFIRHARSSGINTPIILLASSTDVAGDMAALEAGAADFILKETLTGTELDRSVRYALAHEERQQIMQAALKSTTMGVVVFDRNEHIILWNPRFLEFARGAFGDDRDRLQRLSAIVHTSPNQDISVGDMILERHHMPLPGGGHVLALHDVTQRVQDLKRLELAEQRVRRIALVDGLTGLPNRMAFNDYFDQQLEAARSNDTQIALLSFDLDRLKEANDMLGHAAGDYLLRTAAQRLVDVMQHGDYAARLGGSEFVLVQTSSTPERASELGRRVVVRLAEPVIWEGKLVETSASVGIAFYPGHGGNRQELLANADLAMYRAKSDQDLKVCIFEDTMDRTVREHRRMAQALRHAIGENEFTLHFQPQVNAGDNTFTGMEALLRWTSHLHGNISPTEFIPIAENAGIISEIDEWVLRRACRSAAGWATPQRVAVNISARAICHAGIASLIQSILLETGLAPGRLELEITETALIHDLARALHNLRQIKALGISIAMDDFGTGYSSLSLLNSFPFDRIKIDKSFIQSVAGNERTGAIFRSVISLGSALSVPVLVEGIETEEQAAFAIDAGCHSMQGFHFSRPMPETDTRDFLGTHGSLASVHVLQQWKEHYRAGKSDPVISLKSSRLAGLI